MIYTKCWLNLILTILLCLMLMGCAAPKFIEHKQYLFDLPKKRIKVAVQPAPHGCSVFIDHVVAIPPFDQSDFIYRVASGQYLVDYYHGFVVDPAEQLNTIFMDNLQHNYNLNFTVTDIPLSRNKLEIKITELYADYRIHDNPQAVIALHLFLTKVVDGKTVVLSDQVLRSSVPLKAKNTNSLLVSWNVGIQNIFEQIVRILNKKINC